MKFGKAFGDEIGRRRGKLLQLARPEKFAAGTKLIVFYGVTLVMLGTLLLRVFSLTMIHGVYYQNLARENRTREHIVPAPRGIFFDRNGVILVHNVPSFKKIETREEYLARAATDSGFLRSSIILSLDREYVYATEAAHFLGYVGEVSREELAQNSAFQLADSIGRSGIEQAFDSELRGVNGKELIETDSHGSQIRTIGSLDPQPGRNLTLALDIKLQKVAASTLLNKSGAIIVADPTTGEILALASSPSFDSTWFATGDARVATVLSDPANPLLNRTLSGRYPPGSTFKIITAVAGLEEKAILTDTKITDTGILSVGPYSFANWYYTEFGRTEETALDIVGAIKRSNDIYFYKTGEFLGIAKLSNWMRKFGLDKKTGIDLPGEITGLVPDENWKKKAKNEPWFLGDTYHTAIGQGDVLATPLQVNSWTNVIANGGKLCKPRVLKDQKSNIKDQNDISKCKNLGIKKETIELVKEGMRQACGPGGTGWPLFKFKIKNEKLKIDGINFIKSEEASGSAEKFVEISIACKTGTAEHGGPDDKPHAWITAFAPVEKPEISVTVLVESGGQGSDVAGPIAKKIFEEWFGR